MQVWFGGQFNFRFATIALSPRMLKQSLACADEMNRVNEINFDYSVNAKALADLGDLLET